MTPEERAELDRLLDLAEKEKLLELAPAEDEQVIREREDVLRERMRAAVAIQEETRPRQADVEAAPNTKELKWGDPDPDDAFD
jgi:hypothetical protein